MATADDGVSWWSSPYPWLCLLGIFVFGWVVFAYNRLVRHANLVREAWSGIDVQLKRRHNLIPNLVEVVKGYTRFERDVLGEIAALRSRAIEDRPIKDRQDNENALSDSLKTIIALAEDYPQLVANHSYLDLQNQLCEIEDRLQMARRYYNGTVRDYNIRVESFPSNLVAGACGFKVADFFEIEIATQRQAPKVEM